MKITLGQSTELSPPGRQLAEDSSTAPESELYLVVLHPYGRKYGHGDVRFRGTRHECETHRSQYLFGGEHSVHIFRWQGKEAPALGTNVFINGDKAQEITHEESYVCLRVNIRVDRDDQWVATVLSVHQDPEEALGFWLQPDPDVRPKPWSSELAEPTFWVVHWNERQAPKPGQEFFTRRLLRINRSDPNPPVILEGAELDLKPLSPRSPTETYVVVKVEHAGAFLKCAVPDREHAELQGRMYRYRTWEAQHYHADVRVCQWLDTQPPPDRGPVHIEGEYAANSAQALENQQRLLDQPTLGR